MVNPPERIARGTEASFIDMASVASDCGGVQQVSIKLFTGGGARFRSGDTLVARITPCLENGKIALVPHLETDVGFGSTEFVVLRGDGISTDSRFVRYLAMTSGFRDHAEQNLIGSSGRQRVSADVIGRYAFPLPPLEEQERIAGVLGAFDDLIETNRETVRRLDRLGRVVVDSFATANRAAPTVTLAEACDVIESGRRPKGGVKGITSGVPSLGAEFINGLTEFAFDKTKFVPVEFAAQMRRGVIADLDVLVYKDGGKPGEFFPDVSVVGNGYPFDHMVINEHVFRVRGSEVFGQGFLYFWLSTDMMMGLMKEAGSRTAAIPGMNSTNFGQLPIVLPDAEWRSESMEALDQLLVGALSLLCENRDLARKRDELLPLLMSGKVRVRDVEAVVS